MHGDGPTLAVAGTALPLLLDVPRSFSLKMSPITRRSPAAAFVANLAVLVFFFVYATAFTWAFDRLFGLPASAERADRTPVDA
jgi:hypothetical protein